MQVFLCTISPSLQPMDLLVEAPTSGTTNQHVIGRAFLKEFNIFIKENNMLDMNIIRNILDKREFMYASSMTVLSIPELIK